MRLPLFNADWTPTGSTLDTAEYFNPVINRSWELPTDRSASAAGLITFGAAVSIAKELVKHLDIEDIHRSYNFRMGGERPGSFFSPLFKAVFNAFPDTHKYLAFFTGVRSLGDSNNNRDWKVKATTLFPSSVAYQESNRANYTIEFKITYNSTMSAPEFSVEQMAALKDSIAILCQAHDGFMERQDARVYAGDALIPNLVKLIYQFNTNGPLYYPTSRGHTLGGDWSYPSSIATAIAGGSTVRMELAANWDTIQFREVPPTSDRRVLAQVLNYTANVLDYLPFSIKGPKEPNATLYGVELETSSQYSPSDIIAAQKDLFFIMKQDSSIRGAFNNNYEMVSVPCSLRAHKRLWAEFFEKVDYTKFDTSKDTGNGMHVHIDRTTFKSKGHLNRFTWFFIDPANLDFHYAVSERPSKHDMQNWAPFPRVAQSSSRNRHIRNAVTINGSLRGAVHFKGTKTVEVRLFKGIVSYATVLKNLEFVDSIVEYTRFVSNLQMSLSGYLAWLESTPKNKYTMIKQFLTEAKMGPIIASAELDKLLWGVTNEDKIVEKLRKAPFTVTNGHITILNRRRKKRTFTLKGGVIDCIVRNTGFLAKLDKIAQQKQTRGSSSFSVSSL